MTSLFDQWKSFERAVMPADAGAIQREEMRRAFYAGAAATLILVIAAVDPHDNDNSIANLQAIENEVVAFAHDMRAVQDPS